MDSVINRFEKVTRVRDGWMALCPAHADRNPSLHITRTPDGVVLHCFAGCKHQDVLRAAGLEPGDLRPDSSPPSPVRSPETEYIYRDATGDPVHMVRRWYKRDGKKSFAWFHWDNESHSFVPGRGPSEPILYHLDELAHVENKSVVFICEGEKDADRLRSLGYVSTTNPGGAGKWKQARGAGQLAAFDKVIILADNDQPGRDHARDVATDLSGICKDIARVYFDGPEHFDVSDYLDAGGTTQDILSAVNGGPQPRMRVIHGAPRPENVTTARHDNMIIGLSRNHDHLDHLDPPAVRSVQLDTIAAETVKWLFTGRVAEGKLSLIDGDPGLGKSLVVLDWISLVTNIRGNPLFSARCSKLHLEGGDPRGSRVLLLTAEDGLADTVVPRLKAAGADLSKVSAIERSDGSVTSIPEDIPMIEALIREQGAKLLVIDPLVAYFSEQVNANSDQSVRRALAPLKEMAERTKCAILMIRHLNKNAQGTPMYRGGGSIAIIGASRVAMIVAKDPDVPDVRVIATIKSNIGVMPSTLQYRVNPSEADPAIPVVEWIGTSNQDAASILAPVKDRNALSDARYFLLEELNAGPLSARELQKRAEGAGIPAITLRRAKQSLDITSRKMQGTGQWVWCLPWHGAGQGDQDDHDSETRE